MELSHDFWRKCSSCKKNISYRTKHFVCSVSTCTRKRVGYVFCSVPCWERHLPGARHRDAAAVEAMSPSFEEWKQELESEGGAPATASATTPKPPNTSTVATAQTPTGIRRMAQPLPSAPKPTATPKEILVVVSKLKGYIRDQSEMNTSDSVMDTLSDKLRELCDEAIERARKAGRKTVMDRDFTDESY